MNSLTALEQDVMRMLLDGDDPVLAVLREQQKLLTVLEREMTGVGFYANLSVLSEAPRVLKPLAFEIGDIAAQIEGLAHGAGFTLFIRSGVLSLLEGYTYDEPWPAHISHYALSYIGGQRNWPALRKTLHPA